MASINPKTGLLTFRLEKEGYDHVPDFCLFHHTQTVAMGTPVWWRLLRCGTAPTRAAAESEVSCILN